MQIEELIAFEVFLRNETQLTDAGIKRVLISIKRLQKEGALTDRNTFIINEQRRLKMGLNAHTINKDISSLKHYLRFKKLKWQKIPYRKTQTKNVISPTIEQIETFLAIKTTPTFDFYWQVQAYCGTRPGEVLNLRICDLDLERECFYPQKTKTNDHKPIILPHKLIRPLKKYIEKLENKKCTDYLFPSPDRQGKPLTIEAAEKDCKKRVALMNCPLHWTPHTFRHAFITIGFSAGLPTHFVQKAVRHTKITTTDQYADKSIDLARVAVSLHPFYQNTHKKPEEIVDEIVQFVNKKVDRRFNKALVNQAFSLLYQSCKI